MNDIIKAITDDWVECFQKPENQNGFMWRMAGQGVMPEGVDTTDSRVIALCEQARAALGAHKEKL